MRMATCYLECTHLSRTLVCLGSYVSLVSRLLALLRATCIHMHYDLLVSCSSFCPWLSLLTGQALISRKGVLQIWDMIGCFNAKNRAWKEVSDLVTWRADDNILPYLCVLLIVPHITCRCKHVYHFGSLWGLDAQRLVIWYLLRNIARKANNANHLYRRNSYYKIGA